MSTKVVALIGVLDVEGSTNISQAKAFMRVGYKVIPINYRTIINKYGNKYFEELVLHAIKKYRPALTLFCKCNGVNPELVTECNEYTTTFLWNPDPILTIVGCPEVVEHAKRAHFSSCTGGGVAEYFADQGTKECFHIFDGVDYDIFKPVEPITELKADISFIGSKTDGRDDLKEALTNAGYKTRFYGRGYEEEVVNEEFAQVCASSKFMLSLNTYNNIKDYFSNRLLRYMGCGSCVLHLDTTNSLSKYFKDMKEIIYFKDPKELIDKIKDLPNEEIGNIAIAGRNKVMKEFTWDNTIAGILEVSKQR